MDKVEQPEMHGNVMLPIVIVVVGLIPLKVSFSCFLFIFWISTVFVICMVFTARAFSNGFLIWAVGIDFSVKMTFCARLAFWLFFKTRTLNGEFCITVMSELKSALDSTSQNAPWPINMATMVYNFHISHHNYLT